MSTYFIGDVHGCYKNLRTILNNVQFNPNNDVLYLTGDLVSRGPDSLSVLRLIHSFKKSALTVLGNHDLYLLKTYFNINNEYSKNKDNFRSILNAPDSDELMHWLRHQPILHVDKDKKILISHAGINPKWRIKQAICYARDIENILISNRPHLLFFDTSKHDCYENVFPNIYKLKKIQKHIEYFTRMRYIYLNGTLDLQYKDIPTCSPKDIYPWFTLLKYIIPDYSIIFGHWSSLKNHTINMPVGVYGLDSGCCWGGYLTLLRWEDKKMIRVPCNPPA